jgi:hypothetical protein
MSPVAALPTSPTTAASQAFVAARLAPATALGESLITLVGRLPAGPAADLRSTLEGVRRISVGPSTSRAAIIAADFTSSTGRNSAP